MANIQSQVKRIRQDRVRHDNNLHYRSELKTCIKQFENAAKAGDKDAATDAFRTASQKLDKAVTRGIVKKNTAANKKSRMAKVLNNI